MLALNYYYSFQKHYRQVLLGVQTTESHAFSTKLDPGEEREINLDNYFVWNYNLSQGLITLKKMNLIFAQLTQLKHFCVINTLKDERRKD